MQLLANPVYLLTAPRDGYDMQFRIPLIQTLNFIVAR
jgi:hypothetical protein